MAGYCHSWASCPILGTFMTLYVPLIHLQLSGVGFEKTRAAVLLEGHPGQRCKAQIPQEQRITQHECSKLFLIAWLFLVKKTHMSLTFLSTQGHYLVGWYQHPLRLGSKVTITSVKTFRSKVPQTSRIFFAQYVKLLVGHIDNPKISRSQDH